MLTHLQQKQEFILQAMADSASQNISIITDNEQSLIEKQPITLNNNLFDSLDEIKIWAYGLGHFFNDLAGACWFNFLFYYLKRVVKTPSATTMFFVGQITDGFATPTIGYLSDKFNTKYGQRIPWYVGGFVVIFLSFLAIYQNFQSENKTYEYIYYSFVSAFANVGWAAVQISHMSLVPLLTCSRKRRDRLNNLRNTFTFVANFVSLGLGLIVFKFMTDPPLEYKIISYVIAIVGLISSIFFLYHIREVPLAQACRKKAQIIKKQILTQQSESSDSGQVAILSNKQSEQKQHTILEWFKMPKFYLFAICYMGVRLATNMFGTFLPFYLVGVLKLGIEDRQKDVVPFTVALVPLIVYLSSVLSSSTMNSFYLMFGRKMALSLGAIVCLISLCSLFFVQESNSWLVYIISVFIGLSQPYILSTGVNFISDVVGTKAKTGAFVFGIYSLFDKFSAGLVIFFIGNTPAYTKQPVDLNQYQINFIKYTIILIPSISALLAALIIVGYPVKEYTKNKVQRDVLKSETDKIKQQFVMD